MRKIYSILLAGLLPFALHAQEATSDALPFVQIDFNPASLAQGSSVVPTVASIPFADFTISAGGAFEQYMPEISATQYISGGAAGKYGKEPHFRSPAGRERKSVPRVSLPQKYL